MTATLQMLYDRLNRAEKYREVFKGELGEWVLADIGRNCFMTRPTFVAGDPHQTSLNEGSRRAYLAILSQLSKVNRDRIIKQLNEIHPNSPQP